MNGREELKSMAFNYYKELFTLDPDSGGDFIEGKFPAIGDEDK